FECDPTISQCCPTANTTSSTTSPIVVPTQGPNPLAPVTANTASPATSCKDKVNPRTGISECRQRAGLCDVPEYFALMSEQCPSTCKRCPGTLTSVLPSGAACVDRVNPLSNSSDCPFRMEQCRDPVYRDVMMKQCPRTCGFCSSNPSVTTARPIMRNPAVPQMTEKLMKNPFSFGKVVQKKFQERS
ncbi:shTK domain protein, partial [Ancylostoma caninum]